jgi:ElaB/YqjD/DUF883 family membrane-anchored ribosome-binding protein
MSKTHIKDRAVTVADRTKSTVDALADDARSHVQGVVSKVTGAAEHAYGQARGHLRGASAAVEQQPGVAMVLAGFVGAMVGFLLARR